MKTFEHPFDLYELGNHRTIAVELHTQGVNYYAKLFENPIYYFNAFQFIGGNLYRAILGYGEMWDQDFEGKLINSLDYYLDRVADTFEYYFEQIEFLWKTKLTGIKWRRGIKPKKLDLRLRHPKLAERGTRGLARINLLDKPNHVDIEFYGTGEVYTLSYLQYLRLRDNKRVKVKRYEKATGSKANRSGATTPSVQASSGEQPTQALVIKLPGLCSRERGTHSVREARKKTG